MNAPDRDKTASPLAHTPQPPYYVVVFSSLRAPSRDDEYERVARRMLELAAAQPGFLGVESARGADGLGLTVSYWTSLEAIKDWQAHTEHLDAQRAGRDSFYSAFRVRICKVEREYGFDSAGAARS